MKNILHLLAVFLCLICAAPAVAQDVSYSSILNDLPVMPGLAEEPDSLVLFDTPEGRIAEVTLSGSLPAEQVIDYYRAALPELGWQAQGNGQYTRDGQTLSLRTDNGVFVFHLIPFMP